MQEDVDKLMPNISVQLTVHPMVPGYPADWFKNRYLEPPIKIGSVQQPTPTMHYVNQPNEPMLATEKFLRGLRNEVPTLLPAPWDVPSAKILRPSPTLTPGPSNVTVNHQPAANEGYPHTSTSHILNAQAVDESPGDNEIPMFHKKYRRQQVRFPNLTRELEAQERQNSLKLKFTKTTTDTNVPAVYQVIRTPRNGTIPKANSR